VANEPEPGRVRPTRITVLLAAAAVGLVVGWFGGALVELSDGVAPSVPWSSVGVLVFAAAVLGGTAWTTWRTIHRQRRWIDPHKAVNRLVLAKASALVGALMAGLYAGYGARFLDDLTAPLPQERVIRSGLVVLAAVLVVVTALLLEHACRVPKPPDDEKERAEKRERAEKDDGRDTGNGGGGNGNTGGDGSSAGSDR
jgi:uncharacterized membrane protein YgcG